MFQEAAEQKGAVVHPPAPAMEPLAKFRQSGRGVIRHHPSVQVAPDVFHRVELRRIRGQPLHFQPAFADGLPDVSLRLTALMGGQSVPEQSDRAGELAPERLKEADDIGTFERSFLEAQTEANRAAGGRADQHPGHGEAFPVEVVHQGRRTAAGRPGAAHGRFLGEAALVQENQACAAPLGFFLMDGQVRVFQECIVASSRSRALGWGFCALQPSARITRQTWPGW